jgi:hypothetical protein
MHYLFYLLNLLGPMRFLLLVSLLCSLLVLPLQAQSLDTRIVLGEAHARERIEEAVKHPDDFSDTNTLLLNSPELAIATVEPLLFATYGKQKIVRERPYELYLLNDYWYITGTIPKGSKGGGFEVILSASNARVVCLTHYK